MFGDFFDCVFGNRNIALFVDGPNVLRKTIHIDLLQAKRELARYGHISVARVYINQHAPDKLIEAIKNQGFDAVTTTGDVDVTMAVEAMELTLNRRIGKIALITRDMDFLPVIVKAREHNKETILISTDVALGVAIKNSVNRLILFKKDGTAQHIKNP